MSQDPNLLDAAKKFDFHLNGAENGQFINEGDKKVKSKSGGGKKLCVVFVFLLPTEFL